MSVDALQTNKGAPLFGMGIGRLLSAYPGKQKEINQVVDDTSRDIDKRIANYMSTTGINDAVPGSREAFNKFQNSVREEEYEKAKSQLRARLEGARTPGGRRKKTHRRRGRKSRKSRKTRHS